MKIYSYINYLLILGFVLSLQSCDDDFFTQEEEISQWEAATNLKIASVEGKEAFVWEKNLLTEEQYWKNTVVELDIEISSTLESSELEKVDFYITAEESDGFNYTAPFDTDGKLLNTISEIPEDGKFKLTLNAEDVYDLFSGEFKNARTISTVLDGDLFELHWVITAKDGSVMDSRNYAEGDYRYTIKGVNQGWAPPVWEGTYDVEFLEVGAGLWQAAVGDTGEMTITESDVLGTYDIPNLLFTIDIGQPYPGKLVYDFITGSSNVSGSWGVGGTWILSNVDGISIDVEYYSPLYDAYGVSAKVKLTRRDGVNWPTNIHSAE